jgi:hypothetical protein
VEDFLLEMGSVITHRGATQNLWNKDLVIAASYLAFYKQPATFKKFTLSDVVELTGLQGQDRILTALARDLEDRNDREKTTQGASMFPFKVLESEKGVSGAINYWFETAHSVRFGEYLLKVVGTKRLLETCTNLKSVSKSILAEYP